jgi:hypothetical protein
MALATDSPWQAIASAALLGTERQPFQLPNISGNLGNCLSQLSARPNESALLSAAGIVSLHQRVGWLPEVRSVTQVESCPSEDLPRCSPGAARCLQQILEGKFPQLLSEWLEKAAIARQRVPEMLLPSLLDKGRQQRELRAAILSVLGQRGRWLAAQNPDWNYAVALTTEADWETGAPSARLLYLQELRSHNPDHARELLQSTWKQETASDRARFLETFRIELSMADEPFLEDGLGDRSREVRRTAADLLASLPESRLCQRMTERVSALINLETYQNNIQITLPTCCTTDMVRDGIEQQSTNRNLGEKANWLLHMIAVVPLTFWQQKFCKTPVELIQLALLSEWKTVLLDGWARAAKRYCNSDWAQAILNYSGKSARGQVCVEVLSREQIEDLIIKTLQSDSNQLSKSLWLIQRHRHFWSTELAHEVLNGLFNSTFEPNISWELRSALKDFALLIPPELITKAVDLRTKFEDNSILKGEIEEFLSLLQLRQELLQEFELVDGG